MPYRKNKKGKEIFRKNRLPKNMGYGIIKREQMFAKERSRK